MHSYDDCLTYVKDKNLVVDTFIKACLNKTIMAFKYENLPQGISSSDIELKLQTRGACLFLKKDEKTFAVENASYEPVPFSGSCTPVTVGLAHSLPSLFFPQIRKAPFTLGVDAICVKNDFLHVGLLPTLKKYAALLCDAELSLNTIAVLSRITMLISASDDRTKASADQFIKKILNGELSVIGENAFLEGIKTHTASSSTSTLIAPLIGLIQYYKATMLNEVGLNANFNMKRERLNVQEVLLNHDNLLPLLDNMFQERVKGVTEINRVFGTSITVDYSSAWKTTHMHSKIEEALTLDSNNIRSDADSESTAVSAMEREPS